MKRNSYHNLALIISLVFILSATGFVPPVSNRHTEKSTGNSIFTASGLTVRESIGNSSLSFEANRGQADSQVKFLSRGNGYTLFLTSNEAVLSLQTRDPESSLSANKKVSNKSSASQFEAFDSKLAVLRLKLIGANPAPEIKGLEQLPGKSNYFISNDPQKWRTDIPYYSKVEYHEVYPGIDMIYYGYQRQLEYDFVIAPGADPNTIMLAYEGANKLEIDAHGDLILHIADGKIRQRKPIMYQDCNGIRKVIFGGYVLKGINEVGFKIGEYDINKTLVVDPILIYSTYLGGSLPDEAFDITVDEVGDVYVTGKTFSTDFPTSNPLQPNNRGGFDIFVSKLNAEGTAFLYSTYLGGSDNDAGVDIAVDLFNNAYLTGSTLSGDFPTMQPYQNNHAGSGDAFVLKLNPTGSALIYSTYLGGSGFEEGQGIAVDITGSAYLTGTTSSDNFPTANSFDRFKSGGSDVFVTKLNAAGNALAYSTYLGGIENDVGREIAVDGSSGDAYVTGRAQAAGFPYTNLDWWGGNNDEAFVAKFNPGGSALVYSIPFGGENSDEGNGIAVDKSGNVYVTGTTSSTDFPIMTPVQPTNDGDADVFVSKFNDSGSMLLFSTYLGGSNRDEGHSIALDRFGNIYVAGLTTSTNFDTVHALQTNFGGLCDAFVTKFNDNGASLEYSTYLGGSDEDEARGIAVDASGNAYLTGVTTSDNFPTERAFQDNRKGQEDIFVAKIADKPTSVQELADGVPEIFELGQNYPNPFNPSTTIEFSLPRPGYVNLRVFNLLGEEVATLVDQQLPAGRYKTRWDASGYPNGLYFCRLESGQFLQAKKLTLLK